MLNDCKRLIDNRMITVRHSRDGISLIYEKS